MTTPVDPAAAQAAVVTQLGEQAQAVTGDPSAAGVYGDPAGAAQPAQPLDLSAAKAVVVDAQALLARIQELEAKQQAAEAAANPPPPEPDYSLHADPNAPGWLHDVIGRIESRLSKLEG